MKASDFVPPVLLKLRWFVRSPSATFASYGDALQASGANGYADSLVADVVRRKTRRIADGEVDPQSYGGNHAAVSLGLGAVIACTQTGRQDTDLRVLDFGGACGAHYFTADAVLKSGSLRWCVVETANMIAHAREFVQPGLNFKDSIEGAVAWLGGVDLVHASSSLQYVPAPLQTLVELTSAGAPVLVVSRLPLTERPTYSMVQKNRVWANGPGPAPRGVPNHSVAYPVTFLNRSEFENVILERYSLAATWWDSAGNYATPKELVRGRAGLYLKH